VISYGTFLTAVVNLLLIALVLFMLIRAYNKLRGPQAASTKPCRYCFSNIPVAATRCPRCTGQLEAASA
jgi:large conductance mechanosensitive channel